MSAHSRHRPRGGRPWRLGPRAWRERMHRRSLWSVWATATAALALLIVVIVVCVRSMSGSGSSDLGLTVAETAPPGRDVALPMSTFADGHARFYRYVTVTGRETRFFVIKTPDGVVGAAFDACDFCFRDRRGFRQAGDRLICNRCGRAFSSQQVGVLRDECSPAPVAHAVIGDRVIVTAAALAGGGNYF